MCSLVASRTPGAVRDGISVKQVVLNSGFPGLHMHHVHAHIPVKRKTVFFPLESIFNYRYHQIEHQRLGSLRLALTGNNKQ